MRKSDIVELITMARGFDDRIEEVQRPYVDPEDPKHKRIIEDARLAAWHLILADVDVELANRGLVELYQSPQMMRLQPGHIFEAAERVRRRNVQAADLTKLVPPEEVCGGEGDSGSEGARSAEWMQAAIRAIGRGATVADAETFADDELGVSRRLIGPATGRQVPGIDRGSRGLQSMRSRLGESA